MEILQILQILHLIVYLACLVCFIITFFTNEDDGSNIKQMIFFGIMAIINLILILNR